MNPTLAVLLVFFLVILPFLIGIAVFGYYLGRTHQRENINKAWIFIDNGTQVDKPVKGKLIHTSQYGQKYQYRKAGKLKNIIVPFSYPIKFHRSLREIRVSGLGGMIALPPLETARLQDSEKEDLIFELTNSQLVTQAIQAMKGKTSMALIIIIAIVALLIGGIGVYFMTKGKQPMPVSNNITSQVQPNNMQSVNVGAK